MKRKQSRGESESLNLKRQLKRVRAKFETEKNAKNKAYHFILSQGLLDQYKAFNAASLKRLQDIEAAMTRIGDDMRREAAIYEAERADRMAKGLQGDAAVKHYNDWMRKYDLPVIEG